MEEKWKKQRVANWKLEKSEERKKKADQKKKKEEERSHKVED